MVKRNRCSRALLISRMSPVLLALIATITFNPPQAMADSTADPTAVEQQRKIDALTQQIEQMKQEKAALQSKLKEATNKAPPLPPPQLRR
jgi:septal ring factor EnvC (AmiA/AmiB activator)